MTIRQPCIPRNESPQYSLFADPIYDPEKLMEDDLDSEDYVCVNPYEVNPVVETEQESGLRTPLPRDYLKCETPQRSLAVPGGHGFSVTNQYVKLEMEEFGDLSTYLLPKPLSVNSIDELNTPVFAKDAFDFDIFSTHKAGCSNDIKVKLEYDAFNGNLPTTNEKTINFSALTSNATHRKENITSGVTNVHLHSPQQHKHQQQTYSLNMFSPSSENGSVYNYKVSPPNSVDTICAVSAGHHNRHYLNDSVADSQSFTIRSDNGFITPDDSDGSITDEKPPFLRLDVGLHPQKAADNLATPIIIDEVVDLETSNFNILDLVTNEDLSYLATGDIFNNPGVSTVILPDQQETAETILHSCQTPKRVRKRKSYDDDDDTDYLPPRKLPTHSRRSSQCSGSETDSEDDGVSYQRSRGRPRGRPPRRAESVSSDGDSSKYRELRDKNNEASRKSRLKRKCKELELEKEADELNSRNIKLKAQVEELEKMVTNFRDNLFKIMIKK